MYRILALRLIIIIIFAVLVARLYQLQLVDSDTRRYRNSIEVSSTRYVLIPPRRGEILANDGQTRLAESVAISNIGVLPGRLPSRSREPVQRADVLGRLSYLAEMTGTLTISPSVALEEQPDLRDALQKAVGSELPSAEDDYTPVRYQPPTATDALTLTIAPTHTLDVVRITQRYSDVLTFANPIETMIENSFARGYEPVIIKEDIDQNLALAVRENSTYLPGVVVVEGYRRRYPQSASLLSLSHLIGYVGRINECELVSSNPASSWLGGMMDVVGHASNCGLTEKPVDPKSIGIALYQHNDHIGKDGLEGGYEDALRGRIGIKTLLVDALERPVSSERTMQPVQNGNNLVTTIDLDFQRKVETILRTWIAISEDRRQSMGWRTSEYPPITNGSAVVLDARSGRVLAMVSLPAYDNNVWIDPSRSTELQNLLSPADPEAQKELRRLAPLTNRSTSGQYPPGSTLKQFVGAIALQKGIISPNTTLYDPGKILLRERSGHIFELPNSARRNNGNITVSDAMKVSSNVFFAAVAGGNDEATNLPPGTTRLRGLKIDGLAEGLRWFGFGTPTGIRLPGEAAGRVPTPVWKSHALRGEIWTTGDTYNTAIGQGYLEVSPLQLVVAGAAVANGGTVYRPQLVQAITNLNGDMVQEIQPEVTGQVPVEEAYLAVMREGMRRSVTEGSNVAARPECSGLEIAGKTGTAEFGEVLVLADGSATRRSHSWFVGFAPYEQPEIAVVVLLEGTGDLSDGSATLAVPAVTQIMQAYYNTTPPTEDVPPDCPSLPDLPR